MVRKMRYNVEEKILKNQKKSKKMAKKWPKSAHIGAEKKMVDFVLNCSSKKFLKSARIGAEKIIIEKKC